MEEAGSGVAEPGFDLVPAGVGQVSSSRPALALEQSTTSSRRTLHYHPESQMHLHLN